MAQSIACLNLDCGLGHDLRITRLSPVSSSLLGLEAAQDSFSPSPLAPPSPPYPSLEKKINKKGLPISSGRKQVGAGGPVSTPADCSPSPLGSGWDKSDCRPCPPGEGSLNLPQDQETL